MPSPRPAAATVDDYIATFAPEVQAALQQVRQAVRDAAPESEEVISYQIPAYRQAGMLVYFGAFKRHIGLFPPISGDAELQRAAARYAGGKGNLRFPLNERLPLELIARITRLRLQQNLAKAAQRRARPRPGPPSSRGGA